MGSIIGSRRSPGGGHGTPLQCSCLEKPMDGGAWRAAVHGAAESDATEQLGTLPPVQVQARARAGHRRVRWWTKAESVCGRDFHF